MVKKKIMMIMLILAVLILIGNVSAYKLVCLTYGQTLPPESQNPRYTCWHTQCINICTTDSLYPTNPDYCYGQTSCEVLGEPELDITPPKLVVNSPVNEEVYGSTSVLFDMTFNEPASIYWLDNINGRGVWKRVCSNCENSFSNKLRLKEGENNISIKATDRNGNSVEVEKHFYIDSKKPRISRTDPRSGYSNGNFYVEFIEENPKEIIFDYGDDTLVFDSEYIKNSCYLDKKKYHCDISADVSKYENQEIPYTFTVVDIAGNSYSKTVKKIKIDTIFPKLLNNPHFYKQGEGRYAKYLYFNFQVDEENFDEIVYTYTDSRGKLREMGLCSRLKEGKCEAKKAFARGHWDINVEIKDKAGNSISYPISFDVE